MHTNRVIPIYIAASGQDALPIFDTGEDNSNKRAEEMPHLFAGHGCSDADWFTAALGELASVPCGDGASGLVDGRALRGYGLYHHTGCM